MTRATWIQLLAAALLGVAALCYWQVLGWVAPRLAANAGHQATCYDDPPFSRLGFSGSSFDLNRNRPPYSIQVWGEWMDPEPTLPSLFDLSSDDVVVLREEDLILDFYLARSRWLVVVVNGPWILLFAAALLLPANCGPPLPPRSELVRCGGLALLAFAPLAICVEYLRTHPWLFDTVGAAEVIRLQGTAAMGTIVLVSAIRLHFRQHPQLAAGHVS